MWAKGQSPWSLDADDPKKMRYFDAGGNGVAMRILAHAIVGNHDETFRPTAKAILLNGIATHGHPRALIGALAYGFTVWQALRLSGTLGYGQLIELTLNHSDDWAFFPQQNALLSQWQEETQKVHQGRFDQLWTTTKSEILALFEIALAGIRAGAISVDSRVLSELGCFNRAVNGSGTVCAAASIFLASKYAPDPQNGLIQAASSRGADTDTIASMAGALLGVIAGIEWLQRYRNQVQDEQYLTELAQRLESSGFDQGSIDPIGEPTAKPIAAMDRFLESLRKGASGDILELPDGRKALIKEVALLETRSQSLRGKQWKLRTEDGQSLYIKKLERESKIEGLGQATRESDFKVRANTESIRPGIKIKAVKLIVRDLERSRWFYHKVLGLKVYRESKSLVNFGGVISLISLEHRGEFESAFEEGFQTKSILCLESVNIQACHDRVRSFIEAQPTPIYDRAGRRAFRCTDLDGNVIEVYESLRKKLPALGPRP
jgi:ADP-ribosylglycohydrolase/catechol 2,3-dioxygenase-like lactoylglutathione lyase family enzyme